MRQMKAMRSSSGVVAVAIAIVCGLAAPAGAYVRTRVSGGGVMAWRANPRLVETGGGTVGDLGAATVRGVVERALASWSHPAVACTSMTIEHVTGTAAPLVVANDMKPSLIFRETSWCGDTMPCRDPRMLAQTTVFARSRPGTPEDGEIVDVDIEINAVDHRWTVIPDDGVNPVLGARDLGNVLAHELGHFLGLADVCARPGAPMIPRDHLGNAVPACEGAPVALTEATMFPDSPLGDIGKRTLAADDLLGLCEIYPRSAAPADGGPSDAGADLGVAPDVSPPVGADPSPAASPDAGSAMAASGDSGCSCRMGAATRDGGAGWVVLLLAVASARLARRRRRAVALAGLIGALASIDARPAHACKFPLLEQHTIQSDRRDTDMRPPVLSTPAVTIQRGRGPEGFACTGLSASSCDDIGTIQIAVPVSDDQTAPAQCGFRVTLTRGTPPPGLVLPEVPVRALSGAIHLHWGDESDDEQEAISFVLAVAPVDLAGNVGASVEATVSHPGSGGGCALGKGRAPGPLGPLAALALLWAGLRRRATIRAA